MSASNADQARLAYRVLRLREAGATSDSAVRDLAAPVDPEVPEQGIEGRLGLSAEASHPLAIPARSVLNAIDSDAPGATDKALVDKLFSYSDLDSIYETWHEASRKNLQETAPEDLARVEEADAEADRRHADKLARVSERGDFPVHPYFGHLRHTQGAANALYDNGREGFLEGGIDWDTAVIKACLVDAADYTVNLATHEFLSSVAAAGREETSAAFATKTVAAGVADADDITFTAAAGDPVDAIIIYQSSAVTGGADVADTSQRLIAYLDTVTPAFPLALNGGNVTVAWDSGANRIFKL